MRLIDLRPGSSAELVAAQEWLATRWLLDVGLVEGMVLRVAARRPGGALIVSFRGGRKALVPARVARHTTVRLRKAPRSP